MKTSTVQRLAVIGFVGFITSSETWAGVSTFNKEKPIMGSLSTKNSTTADYPKLAKVSATEAIKSANEKITGDVLSVGLENEDGYLVYAVMVSSRSTGIHELIIDAGNGQFLADHPKFNSSDDEDDDEGSED